MARRASRPRPGHAGPHGRCLPSRPASGWCSRKHARPSRRHGCHDAGRCRAVRLWRTSRRFRRRRRRRRPGGAVALPGGRRSCWSNAHRKWRPLPQPRLAHPGNAHLGDRASVLDRRCHAVGPGPRGSRPCRQCLRLRHHEPALQRRARTAPRPTALRKEAHVMEDGLFDSWIRSAAAVVRPRGGLAVIARPEQLGDILDGDVGPLRRCRDAGRPPAPRRGRDPHRRQGSARRARQAVDPPAADAACANRATARRSAAEMINNGLRRRCSEIDAYSRPASRHCRWPSESLHACKYNRPETILS